MGNDVEKRDDDESFGYWLVKRERSKKKKKKGNLASLKEKEKQEFKGSTANPFLCRQMLTQQT